MKVLFLTPYLPSPPRFGGQRRMHGLMTEVARHHEVFSLSFVDPRGDTEASVLATNEYCRRVVTVPNPHLGLTGGARKRAQQLFSLAGRRSYEHIVTRMRAMQAALDRLLREEPMDLVQVEFSQMAVYRLPNSIPRPRLCLDEHNVEYDVLKRTAGAEVGIVRRLYNAINWRKLRAEERRAWGRFDGCVFTSDRDRRLVERDAPRLRTAVVPNGVDIDSFAPTPFAQSEPDTVLFFGAINYYPNTEGLLFFLREVWPALKALRPASRFRIVGPQPPEEIRNWRDPSVEVMGFVDDIRKPIARSAVVVVPLRIGGGTRLKVLEAMALAKPIVSTHLGAEGIDVTHGRDILLADHPKTMASEIARALGDAAMAQQLGEAARELVVARYSWRAAAQGLMRFYGAIGASA